jgi:hypothetical protein
MFRFRPRFAALFVGTLAAAAMLSVVHIAGNDDGSSRQRSGETALVVRAERVDASAVRVSNEPRRQLGDSHRLLTQRLILFAVVAALFVGLVLSRRSMIAFARFGRLQLPAWSPRSGRAPPVFTV